jgi:oligoribonuclease NrnB/cAMP/cGMP phosphodiesterase (DHH superfamily)
VVVCLLIWLVLEVFMGVMVIYHGGCFDGFGAAWAFWRFYGEGPHIEYVPAWYGSDPPDVTGKDVFLVDFSYPREVLEELHRKSKSLLVLDHHKTAEAELRGLPWAQFDMERSGAGMAWDHLFGGESRPWLVNYLEDRDLWRWALPDSRAVSAYIGCVEMDFDLWLELSCKDFSEVVCGGQSILKFIDRYVREMSEQARMCKMGEYTVPVVNAPYINTSELVGELAKQEGVKFAVGWFQRGDGKYQYSLRSRTDFDVSEIALRYGGGGHAQAAGFVSEKLVHT